MNLELIILLTNSVLIIIVAILVVTKKANKTSKLNDSLKQIKDEIRFSFQPMADIPTGVEEISELALEVWKIQQRLSKTSESMSETHRRALENSVQRLFRFLQKFDVEFLDHDNQKYNEGLNLDVLSVEKDTNIDFPIIKETVEPTIMCRGRVIKRAKVIILSNQ
jgi:predicted Holliday junction resolvase-like endonuclease